MNPYCWDLYNAQYDDLNHFVETACEFCKFF